MSTPLNPLAPEFVPLAERTNNRLDLIERLELRVYDLAEEVKLKDDIIGELRADIQSLEAQLAEKLDKFRDERHVKEVNFYINIVRELQMEVEALQGKLRELMGDHSIPGSSSETEKAPLKATINHLNH
jgi:predicted RNase H-like nuclease (RuvC/YqgF family)